MEFHQFIDQLRKALQQELPGQRAQFKMAPKERILGKAARLLNPNAKLSAVLCMIYPINGRPHTLLTLRNSYGGVHSAQVSFPGGKQDPADPTLMATALREAEEEVRATVKEEQVLGELTEMYIPPSGYLIHPFIAALDDRPGFRKDVREVHTLIEIPIDLLLDDAIVKRKKIKVSMGNLRLSYPYFDVYGHTVWGATAMMLSELKEVVKGFSD